MAACAVALAAGAMGFSPVSSGGPAQPGRTSTSLATGALAARPVRSAASGFAISKPLRQLDANASAIVGDEADEREAEPFPRVTEGAGGQAADPVVQRELGKGAIPGPNVSFEGIPQVETGRKPHPPDTNGEIGPNHYVQIVNLRVAVFSRTGHLLMGPIPIHTVLAPLGDRCGVVDRGDPIVLYDQLADRWLLTQFGFLEDPSSGDPVGPYYECIAVSKTADPTGAYYLYAFKISDTLLNDYPHLGVWPDAYYMAFNGFNFAINSVSFGGAGAVAFDRAKMLAGDPTAGMVAFNIGQNDPSLYSLLPSDLDGHRLPPQGAPNLFVELGFDIFQGPIAELRIYRFHVDWANPGASSFTGPSIVPTAPYNAFFCDDLFEPCVSQKGTFSGLDTLSDRLMFRLAYRNFGDHQALVVNHTVNVGDDQAGVRWYEIRNPGGTPVLFQQGTFAPDQESRWMGSIAMDGNGDIGLGYSVSGPDMYPSIRYTGQLAAEPGVLASHPLGEMTLGEGELMAGTGSQTSVFGRWGDYSDMTVDPVDDCTFWYTQEYYVSVAERDWHTRIGSFTFPSCDATPPSVQARPARAKAKKTARLTFTVSDNKGAARETITVFRPNGKKLKTIVTALGPATGGTESVSVKAPALRGTYRWSVVATDGKGNESAESSAPLKVT